MNRIVKLDSCSLDAEDSSPMTFVGPFSQKELAGIDIEAWVESPEDVAEVSAILKRGRARVADPFVGREYEADVRMRSSMSRDGRSEQHFTIDVRERDVSPKVDQIDISGEVFEVIGYRDSLIGDGRVSRDVLLRLSPSDVERFQKVAEGKTLMVKRVGVDSTAMELRFGSHLYWSEHGEKETRFVKQMLWLFPHDYPPTGLDMATGSELMAMRRMLFGLMARCESLIERLTKKGALTEEDQAELFGGTAASLVGEDKLADWFWRLEQVDDAADRFLIEVTDES